MLGLVRYHLMKSKILESFLVSLTRLCHLKSAHTSDFSDQSSLPSKSCVSNNVGVFWDLKSRPNCTTPAYDAACAVKGVSGYLGTLQHTVAYADSTAYAPYHIVMERFDCEVCNKLFYSRDLLISHLKKKHEPVFRKHMADIEAGSGRKVTRMEQRNIRLYSQAMRHLLGRSERHCMVHEVKRAGFWVQDLPESPPEAENAMKSHMLDLIHRREVQCVVLITGNSNLCDVLGQAKMEGLKTITVGTLDEQLKGYADTSFTWTSIIFGKAKRDVQKLMNK